MAKKSNAVIKPNLGLYYDRPPITMDPRMLSDGLNFRVKSGQLSNVNLGYALLTANPLNGPVTLVKTFRLLSGIEVLMFASVTDLYSYDSAGDTVAYITPRYETGTAAVSGTAVTGTGTTWSTNVKAGDEMYFGAAGQTDPTATWYVVDTVNSDTSITLTTSAGTIANGAYTARKLLTGDLSYIWSTAVFTNASPSVEDELWLTNGVDSVFRWNGSDDQVEAMSTSLGFTCKVLAVYKNMMIFLNLIQSGTAKPTDMINSNPGEPQNVTTGLSSQFKVSDSPFEITAAKQLGDNFAIYNKDRVTVSQFTGDDLVFIFRTAILDKGCRAFRGVADFGNYHEFIGPDGQYLFDGITVKETNQHVWREIIRQQDPTRIANAFGFFDNENGDLVWSIPSASDASAGDPVGPPEIAFGEHYLEGLSDQQNPTPFSKRSFPFTAVGYFSRQAGLKFSDLATPWDELTFHWNDQFFFSSFPIIVGGDNNGYLYTLNTNQNAAGAAITSYVTFARRAVVDSKMRGLVTRIYTYAAPFDADLNVTLRLMDHANGEVSITDTQTFDQNLVEGGHFTAHYRRGRFFEVQYGTSGLSEPWEIAGYDIEARAGGNQ